MAGYRAGDQIAHQARQGVGLGVANLLWCLDGLALLRIVMSISSILPLTYPEH